MVYGENVYIITALANLWVFGESADRGGIKRPHGPGYCKYCSWAIVRRRLNYVRRRAVHGSTTSLYDIIPLKGLSPSLINMLFHKGSRPPNKRCAHFSERFDPLPLNYQHNLRRPLPWDTAFAKYYNTYWLSLVRWYRYAIDVPGQT